MIDYTGNNLSIELNNLYGGGWWLLEKLCYSCWLASWNILEPSASTRHHLLLVSLLGDNARAVVPNFPPSSGEMLSVSQVGESERKV